MNYTLLVHSQWEAVERLKVEAQLIYNLYCSPAAFYQLALILQNLYYHRQRQQKSITESQL